MRQALDDGALVVDVRTELQFDEAHIPGAVSNHRPARGFGSNLHGWPRRGKPLVLVGRDDEPRRQRMRPLRQRL